MYLVPAGNASSRRKKQGGYTSGLPAEVRFAAFAEKEDLNSESVRIELDGFDDELAEPLAVAKRLCDFICAQKIKLYEENELIGMMHMSGCPVPADTFSRTGHVSCLEALHRYYRKPQENPCIMEWQHSNSTELRRLRILRKMFAE